MLVWRKGLYLFMSIFVGINIFRDQYFYWVKILGGGIYGGSKFLGWLNLFWGQYNFAVKMQFKILRASKFLGDQKLGWTQFLVVKLFDRVFCFWGQNFWMSKFVGNSKPISERISERISKPISKRILERILERISKRISKQIFKYILELMSHNESLFLSSMLSSLPPTRNHILLHVAGSPKDTFMANMSVMHGRAHAKVEGHRLVHSRRLETVVKSSSPLLQQ